MAGMSGASRARSGYWGGTGDGTPAQSRRHARRVEGYIVAADIADELADDDGTGSYWADLAQQDVDDNVEAIDPCVLYGCSHVDGVCVDCGDYDPDA